MLNPPISHVRTAVTEVIERRARKSLPHRLLLVEDDPSIARMFALGLTQAGYEVQLVTDGRSALEALRAGPVDLVLLDVRLHGMDGIEVLEAIRHDSGIRHTRVVMLSNYSEQSTVEACLERGALDYVFKWSITPRELAQTCVRWLLE
jgi:CheY-like chemotaxis protein